MIYHESAAIDNSTVSMTLHQQRQRLRKTWLQIVFWTFCETVSQRWDAFLTHHVHPVWHATAHRPYPARNSLSRVPELHWWQDNQDLWTPCLWWPEAARNFRRIFVECTNSCYVLSIWVFKTCSSKCAFVWKIVGVQWTDWMSTVHILHSNNYTLQLGDHLSK